MSTYPESFEVKEEEVKPEPKKCGCGATKNPDGFCDGTHTTLTKPELTPQ